MNSFDTRNMKIYTLSIPPSPEDPYLNPNRHQRIIKRFKRGDNVCHTLNSQGEVDFYLLLATEEDFDEYPEMIEEFGLNIQKDNKLQIELYYDEELFGTFHFDLNNQLDSYCLSFLAEYKRINIYFINTVEEDYVCYGFKTINLPSALCYDLSRQLTGQRPLTLPNFNQDYSDDFITKDLLLSKAWGFYVDYTALLERLGSNEEAEEIISLHILHGMARLQKSRRKAIMEDKLILWVGRRISLDCQDRPKEYYSIYLSGAGLTGRMSRDIATSIIQEALQELPEYWGNEWVSPLAEEAVPLVVLTEHNLYRLKLGERFYALSRQLFMENYRTSINYQSYYDRLYLLQNEKNDTKIYNLWLKRWEQGYDETKQLPVRDIEVLIESGKEEDLTRIFMLLAKVPERDLDNLIVKLCETYQSQVEPYLLIGLQATLPHLRAAALLGLGILESTQAIPSLVRLIRLEVSDSLTIWDTLLMIGDPAVPALAELLHEPVPAIREKALETLKLLGIRNPVRL